MLTQMWVYYAVPAAVIFAAGVGLGTVLQPGPAEAQPTPRVFEIRTYTAHDGKLETLQRRFRDHTTRYFEKHGMTNVGYWRPLDAPLSGNTLVYILAYPSREAATRSWEAFRTDPGWLEARAASESGGPVVSRTESIFLEAEDYSPIR